MTERGNLKNVAIIFLFFLVIAAAAKAKTIYVDADANSSGAGTNWDNAYNYLQDALADANTSAKPVEIRVAQGTYKPDDGAGVTDGDRTATFQLINGVTLKGGYAGFGEPDPNVRDIEKYETVLSGDLDGNDVGVNDPCDLAGETTRAENSYHVVTGSGTDATTILDGFTITGGYADGSYPNSRGGGMYNESGSPMVVNCTFRMNLAHEGGGMAGKNAELILRRCTFSANAATIYGGGGLLAYRCSATITRCVFRRNLAGGFGGAVDCLWCDALLNDCTVSDNRSGRHGGGISISASKPILTRCKFSGNWGRFYGGGIYCEEISSPTISNCAITGNRARYNGGGIFGFDDSSPTLVNCTISGNAALDKGGGICYEEGGRLIVRNCIVWGNTASDGNEMAVGRGMTADVNYCDVKGGREGVYVRGHYTLNWGPGNIDANPRFVEPGYWDSNGTPGDANDDYWVDGDYHLLTGSPCIDAGDNNSVPEDINDLDGDGNTTEPIPWDLDGNPRFVDGDSNGFVTVDMGAYEYRPPIYVDRDAPGPVHDGSSWATAYKYLQDALAVAVPGGEKIWVAQGIYTPDSNSADPNSSGDRAATFQLISDVALRGGYAGFGAPNPNARNINVFRTILSGDLDGNDVQVAPSDLLTEPTRAENSYHVVTGGGTDANAVLDGFTVTAGNANETVNPNKHGGGMHGPNGSPTLLNCTFSNNSAYYAGGGIATWDEFGSGSKITNCKFSDNYGKYGGGMYASYDLTLINCTFSGNTSNAGGAMYIYSDAIITNCTFSGNSARGDWAYGGGMMNSQGSPTLTNCTFIGNSADWLGGGMSNWEEGSNPTLIGCTFSGNSAYMGGGMYNHWSGSPTLTNCTFSGNSAIHGGGMKTSEGGSPTLTGCTFSGNSASRYGGGMLNFEDSSPMLTNCTFSGNSAHKGGGMITCEGASPTLTGCTFSGNSADMGGGMYDDRSTSTLTNCILWGNTASGGSQIYRYGEGSVNVSYSDVQGSWPGLGNIDADPCFVEPGRWADANDPNITVEPNDPNAVWIDGDYHLKSEGWRWDTEFNPPRWGYDYVTSRCIDAGNPGSALCEEPISVPEDANNVWGQNLRINMGAYGGTAEASMPPYDWALLADITNDGTVDFADYAHLAAIYTDQDDELPADFDRDGNVDLADLRLLAEDWLKQTSWYEP